MVTLLVSKMKEEIYMNKEEIKREENLLEGLTTKVDQALDYLLKGDIKTEEYSHTLNNIFGTSNLINILRQQANMRAGMNKEEEEILSDLTEEKEMSENVEN